MGQGPHLYFCHRHCKVSGGCVYVIISVAKPQRVRDTQGSLSRKLPFIPGGTLTREHPLLSQGLKEAVLQALGLVPSFHEPELQAESEIPPPYSIFVF